MEFDLGDDKYRTLEELRSKYPFVFSSRINPDPQDSRKVLVSVHSGLMDEEPGMLDEMRELEGRFGSNVYFAQLNPERLPKNGKKPLPRPGELGDVYVCGCYLGACLDAQISFLDGKGYGDKIRIIEDMVL